jgi:flagellum-specific ATP synthase
MDGAQLPGPSADRNRERAARLAPYLERALDEPPSMVVEGRLRRTVGLTMEAEGCHAPVGGRCDVMAEDGRRVETEVVGFAGERLFLMPAGEMRGIVPNARVIPLPGVRRISLGEDLLGRVLDGHGRPLDGGLPPRSGSPAPLFASPINPLERQPIREPLDVGVRSINALLTLGRGQRMGLFAGSGVGKSMLLGMMTRNTNADVVVVGLIGERGREVKEFIDHTLGEDGLRKAVVVATPADDTPLMRLHGAWLSTAIAEYFRDRGKQVLLLMDSLTRFAHAQREIGLAIGEPPATKGYPPSVFAKLPQLVERAGNGAAAGGSITAIYTVLQEGDDHNDPIVDASRAILDGHITLSRKLAESGLYPAIDIEASVSRALTRITAEPHQELIGRFRRIYSVYQEHRDLIAVGAYQRGSDPRVDDAIARWPAVLDFLRQRERQRVDLRSSIEALKKLLDGPSRAPDASADEQAAGA